MTPLKFKLISQLRFNYTNNVLYEGDTTDKFHSFEQAYIGQRRKEDRVYDDETVANLPNISPNHPRAGEWALRKHSLEKLNYYLVKKESVDTILEVGCGNGWMAAQLALNLKAEVTGIDINNAELEQAKRIFYTQPNLSFTYGDLRDVVLGDRKFDIIIFAASIQYFSSLSEIITIALKHLSSSGEIHIMDSHFYRLEEVVAARQRTKDYYVSMGFSQLTPHYHHHSIESLNLFNYTILQNPYLLKNKLLLNKNPFHWIAIRKKSCEQFEQVQNYL